jgi:triphosphoribosyl-dephospho-CoA synthase
VAACMQAPANIGLHCQLACIWEASACKPGNVHRFQDFTDLSYLDLVTSAAAVGQVCESSNQCPLGDLVWRAILLTRQVSATNTNLGMVLLLAPLAKAAARGLLRAELSGLLAATTVRDAHNVYRAIRLAAPGGLGRVDDQDVQQTPTHTLRQAMSLAADRDLIARQYADEFHEVFNGGVPALQRGLEDIGTLEGAVIFCHLQLLRLYPDSLIARKCGLGLAEEASRRATQVIDAGWPQTALGRSAIDDFDAWLRADGHRRNPGTTADLVAASLFVALREGIINLPLQVPWSMKPLPLCFDRSRQNGQGES